MEPPKSIGFELKMLANLMRRKLEQCITPEDGEESSTGLQGWVIGYVVKKQDEPVYQRDIEREFRIRRATVTGVLQLMERNGLIIREPVEHDARLKRITLTPKALELHECNVRRFKEFEVFLRRGLSEDELASFFAVVEKLKKNLE